jgi:hypothetical protein
MNIYDRFVDRERYGKYLAGFFVRDASLGFSEFRIAFLLVRTPEFKDDLGDGWDTRLITFNLEQPMPTRVFSMTGNNISHASIASSWSPDHQEYVAVDTMARVWAYKPKTYKGSEPPIPFRAGKLHPDAYGEYAAAIHKTVRVGTTVFAIGAPFRIFERIDNQQWREHTDIPIPADIGSPDREVYIEAIGNCDFKDLAGLSVDDMYAVGSAGVVWRRQAGQWRQLAFPSHLRLHTVAVAPDGTAYITDIRGSVWRGRDESWERIVHADMMLAYQDSAWFAGRLWCTNDSAGPFVLEDGAMVSAHRARVQPMPAQVARFAHRIDVSPDGKSLLVAGMQGAALYDGSTWTVLFDGEPEV